ncbi:conidiation-specific protein 10 [Exophiala spinifera]|uniref:Conidiation-specific protein 10 n=1 Tax=Exophiala spinifera TaxID=91928 RepID=A0A0D2AW80_9EURO|nr:conidiation-specific protein 10 [Exophiala spinifera]KIW10755.1 conidiation-specific protein 10 [Exophiala spinifera]
MSSKENNPGNFANRPKEEVKEIASKGGHSSAGGFASMDPDKQASSTVVTQSLQIQYANRDKARNRFRRWSGLEWEVRTR